MGSPEYRSSSSPVNISERANSYTVLEVSQAFSINGSVSSPVSSNRKSQPGSYGGRHYAQVDLLVISAVYAKVQVILT